MPKQCPQCALAHSASGASPTSSRADRPAAPAGRLQQRFGERPLPKLAAPAPDPPQALAVVAGHLPLARVATARIRAAAGSSGGALVDNGLPGRALVRRLSNTEYDATIVSLLGDKTGYAAAFPTDTVVNGFSNNTDVQDVPPALAEQYMVVSEQIAANATKNTDTLLGCKLSAGEACINDFITRFGLRAWRRPITAIEQTDLLSVYRSGADSTTGVRLLLEAFLVSPSFLYRVEVGVPVAGKTYRALTSWEIASRLSYFLTGTMPDDQLFATAQADRLDHGGWHRQRSQADLGHARGPRAGRRVLRWLVGSARRGSPAARRRAVSEMGQPAARALGQRDQNLRHQRGLRRRG